MSDEKQVMFTPFVSVTVEEGRVTDVSIDWSDSCMGTNGEGFNEEDSDERAACEFIDNPQRQESVLNALTINP